MQTSYELPPIPFSPPSSCPACGSATTREIEHTATRAWRRCRCKHVFEAPAKPRGSISVEGIVVRCYEVSGGMDYAAGKI